MKTVLVALLIIVAKMSFDKPWTEAATMLKFELSMDSKDNSVCPDSTYCPGDETCCPMGGGHYGCCPFAHAVCCSDLVHCCPSGKICNVSAGTCIGETSFEDIIPWAVKRKSTKNGN